MFRNLSVFPLLAFSSTALEKVMTPDLKPVFSSKDSRGEHVLDHGPHEIIIPEQRFVFDSIDDAEM